MTTERDTTRIVRSWLRTDEHESAGRVLDNVLAVLDATPQRRRPLLPAWRIAPMNTYAKLAIAAAAVVVVAVVGYNLLPGSGPGPGGLPTPSPTSTAPEVTAPPFPSQGPLSIGTHLMTIAGTTISFEIPTEGWKAYGDFGIDYGSEGRPDGVGGIFWTTKAPVGVYSDPCLKIEGPALGEDRAQLAAAVYGMSALEPVTAPTEGTVGGHPATRLAVRVPDTLPCDAGAFYLWYDKPDEGRYATAPGSTIYTWIIDGDGSLVWIDFETYAGAGPEPLNQIEEFIDSIRFG